MRGTPLALLFLVGCQYSLSSAGERVAIVTSPPLECGQRTTSIAAGGGMTTLEELRNYARNTAAPHGDTILIKTEWLRPSTSDIRSSMLEADVYDCSRAASIVARGTTTPAPSASVSSSSPSEAPSEPSALGCATPFVVLSTLAETSPETFDVPTLRAALEGHPELARLPFIEGRMGTNRVFGAIAPDRSYADELARVVLTAVASSSPNIVCVTPKHAREIDMRDPMK